MEKLKLGVQGKQSNSVCCGERFSLWLTGGFRETVVLDHGVCIAVIEETPCPVTWAGSLLVPDPTLYFERLVSENMPTVTSTLNLPNLFCSDKLFLGESLYFSKRLVH